MLRKEKGFVIDAMPRTGSTTLANALNAHPDIRCMIEPFHPKRYEGHFHRMALSERSVKTAVRLIWCRWEGFKHVWEAGGFPFGANKELNKEIVLSADRVIFLRRRNLLRRCVSSFISKQLNFWIGTREDFLARLEAISLRELDVQRVSAQIREDQVSIEQRLQFFKERGIQVKHVFYEDLYRQEVACDRQRDLINSILSFLGFSEVSAETFAGEWLSWFDADTYQWASADTYRAIPGIETIEREVGSNETGWLLR